MKKFVFISLTLLLLIIMPGCFTVQTVPQEINNQSADPATITIFNPGSGKGSEIPPMGTPSVIGTFSSYPTTINPGDTSKLTWNVTGANYVSIDQGIGQVNAAGTVDVSPAASTTYTISATNSAGTVTRSAVTLVESSPSIMPFSVINAVATTELSNSNGCFNLNAYITANGAGSATYIWESTDGGGYSYTWSITFPAAGTQKISLPVEMSGLPSGPYRVHVLTPNDLVSNSTQYTTCAP